jgi:hypothetical protein
LATAKLESNDSPEIMLVIKAMMPKYVFLVGEVIASMDKLYALYH